MLGSLRSLKPGAQGGGFTGKKKSGDSNIGPAPRPGPASATGPALRQGSRPLNALEAAIQAERSQAAAEARGQKQRQFLPDWIVAGQRVGYLSSSGRVCEGFIDSISLEKCEVKFVFAQDENIWKRVPFATILSKANPLRRLAVPGDRSKSMTEILDAAQQSDIDKSIMLQRVVGEAAFKANSAKAPNSDGGNSGSAAPEPGSAPGSECSRSRSRSRSPRITGAESSGLKQGSQLPEWITVGKRVLYWSSSSGRCCEVDIDSISMTEVKIVFVDDRTVWKGIPFSMIRSERNPLKPMEGIPSGNEVVDLSDCSEDGSLSPKPAAAKVTSPQKSHQLPDWVAVGQRLGYLSKSIGKFCQVEVSEISLDKKEVKIVFMEDREVWKVIPFSMILGSGNPLRRM